ncbi:hypothetical protein ACWDOR_07275 [Streptosporangium canum]
MHHTNHFYGHAHIFARYCGLDRRRPPRINGYLQHGWNALDGFGPRERYVPATPKFVWTDTMRRRGWARGRRDYYPIGAPWLYLTQMEPPAVPEPEREGTIWYPFHGWERQHVDGDHQRLIDEIREVERGPVTVCLYWLEFGEPKIRGVYEDAGFRVISHGVRGWMKKGTDPLFPHRQLAELRRHRRVASNRLSTAVFHGIAAGCEPAVYGDPMVLAEEDPMHGGAARVRRLWPELHGAEVDLVTARQIAAEELGVRYRVSPEEIRTVFGWSGETNDL